MRASQSTTTIEDLTLREEDLLAQLDELEAALAAEHATSSALAHRLRLEEEGRGGGIGQPAPPERAQPSAEARTQASEETQRTKPQQRTPSPRAGAGLVRRLAEELSAGTTTSKKRAASRLASLLGVEAGTLLAEALQAEGDEEVVVYLCDLIGRVGDGEAFEQVLRLHASGSPSVRAAATGAALALAQTPADLGRALRRGLADPAAAVRRRTILAATAAPFDVGPLVVDLLRDEDAHVRRLTAVALGGTASPGAAAQIPHALLDVDAGVRRAAQASAARLFGARAAGIAALPERERRRKVASLEAWVAANLEILAPEGRIEPAVAEEAVAAEEIVPAADPTPAAAIADAAIADAAIEAEPAAPIRAAAPALAEAPEAEAEAPEVAPAGSAAAAPVAASKAQATEPTQTAEAAQAAKPAAAAPALPFAEVETVLLAAIRGARLGDLVEELGRDREVVEGALETFLEEGRLVRRGKKFFLP